MFTDPTGMSKDGVDNDYLLDDNNNVIGVTYNNSPDRYFKESDKSSTSVGFKFQDGSTKYGEQVSVPFQVIEVFNENTGAYGHSGIGFDGNVYSYYPISKDGSYPGNFSGSELGQIKMSNSDLRSNNCTTNVVNHLIKSKILDNSSSENYRPGLFNKFLDSKVSSKIIREPSIINNLKQSFNNISINGKNIKK